MGARAERVLELGQTLECREAGDVLVEVGVGQHAPRVDELGLVDLAQVALALGDAKRAACRLDALGGGAERGERDLEVVEGLLDLEADALLGEAALGARLASGGARRLDAGAVGAAGVEAEAQHQRREHVAVGGRDVVALAGRAGIDRERELRAERRAREPLAGGGGDDGGVELLELGAPVDRRVGERGRGQRRLADAPRQRRAQPFEVGVVDRGQRQRPVERGVADQVDVALREPHAVIGGQVRLFDLEHVRLRPVDEVARDLAVDVQAVVDAPVGARQLERRLEDAAPGPGLEPAVVGSAHVAVDAARERGAGGVRGLQLRGARVARCGDPCVVQRLRQRDFGVLLAVQQERDLLVRDCREACLSGQLVEAGVDGVQQVADGEVDDPAAVGSRVARVEVERRQVAGARLVERREPHRGLRPGRVELEIGGERIAHETIDDDLDRAGRRVVDRGLGRARERRREQECERERECGQLDCPPHVVTC